MTRKPRRAPSLTCVRCGESKTAESFVRDRTRTTGRFPWCKVCVTESRRAAREERFEAQPSLLPAERVCPTCETSLDGAHRNRLFCSYGCKDKARRWAVFGLTPAEYRALVDATGGRCPICDRKVTKWFLDHNHDTGETTGVVCSVCNQSLLAYSRHDVNIARALVVYLHSPPVHQILGGPRYVGPDGMSQLERERGWANGKRKGSVGLAHAIRPERVP